MHGIAPTNPGEWCHDPGPSLQNPPGWRCMASPLQTPATGASIRAIPPKPSGRAVDGIAQQPPKVAAERPLIRAPLVRTLRQAVPKHLLGNQGGEAGKPFSSHYRWRRVYSPLLPLSLPIRRTKPD
jgi:hypothetical protein